MVERAELLILGFIAATVVAILLWVLWEGTGLVGSAQWRWKRYRRREIERLVRARTPTLLSQLRERLQGDAFASYPEARAFFESEEWTDARLLDQLTSLVVAIRKNDLAAHSSGPDSHTYIYFDSGLENIREALEVRARGSRRDGGNE